MACGEVRGQVLAWPARELEWRAAPAVGAFAQHQLGDALNH